LAVIEVGLALEAIVLNENDIMNKRGHLHVFDCGDKFLPIVNHNHYLPTRITIS